MVDALSSNFNVCIADFRAAENLIM